MEHYKKDLFGGRDIIDGHLHIQGWKNDEGDEFFNGVEWYKDELNLRSVSLAAMPCGYRDASQNIMCFFYKLFNPNTYVHAGITYPEYPVNPNNMGNMELETQYNEIMEIGADGIKMLEGKPSIYKYVQVPLCDSFYDKFFSLAERDNTHILMHACDPIDFWDRSKMSEEEIKKGWFYGDGEHITKAEMHEQVYKLLEKHPSLHLTLAHFFFMSSEPEKIEELFAKYKNLNIDITPGGEMYVDFAKRRAYFKEFFTKYADRIQFGTDGAFPSGKNAMRWLCDRIYTYLATDEAINSWGPKPLQGIKLDTALIDKIFCTNFINKVGEAPKELNKKALKAYIEKYKHLIRDKQIYDNIEELKNKLL